MVEDHAERLGVPRASRPPLVEGDGPMMEKLKLSENEIDMVGHIVKEMEQELGTDREAALADMRYQFIDKLCSGTVVKNGESREHRRSVQIDKLLTHKIFAIPIFLAIMLLIFWLTFGLVGAWLSDLLSLGIDSLTQAVDGGLTAYGINPVVHSLIIDGVFAGVGSVLSFYRSLWCCFSSSLFWRTAATWPGWPLLWIRLCVRSAYPAEALCLCSSASAVRCRRLCPPAPSAVNGTGK